MDSGISVGIVGAGVSGMAAGLCLDRRGVEFTIFEKAYEVGGTWRENRYPGLTIDVPSLIYTFSGQRNPHWRRLLPAQAEILDYHREVSIRTGLRERIRFGCEVTAARWTGASWELVLSDGSTEAYSVLVCATGFLHHPRIPDIDGLDSFGGECVHSARWPDTLELAGRRVGVIGGGSTGVQLVAALAGVASQLTSFQRTPQWIFPGLDIGISPVVQRALERAPRLHERLVQATEWFADWLLGGASARPSRRRALVEWIARRHLATVRDAGLRLRLTPKDSALCKRPVVSSRYYRAVQRDDVEVVTEGIAGVEPAGVRMEDGRLYELDVLVLATGFQAHNFMRPMRITGDAGQKLDATWARGPYGYRTMTIPGFPNLFMILGPHSPLLSVPIHTSAELQSEYMAQMVDLLRREPELVSVAVRPAAAERWLAELQDGMPGTVWTTGCTSWYLGDADLPVLWPFDRRRWRAALREPVLADYELQRRADGGHARPQRPESAAT